jgi:hypothetical protein
VLKAIAALYDLSYAEVVAEVIRRSYQIEATPKDATAVSLGTDADVLDAERADHARRIGEFDRRDREIAAIIRQLSARLAAIADELSAAPSALDTDHLSAARYQKDAAISSQREPRSLKGLLETVVRGGPSSPADSSGKPVRRDGPSGSHRVRVSPRRKRGKQ